MTAKHKVITAKPGSELRTLGGVPWLVSGERCCQLSPSNGGTHVADSVTYSGPVSWLLPIRSEAFAAAAEEGDQALKARAEAIHRTGQDPDLSDQSPVAPPSDPIGHPEATAPIRNRLPALPRVVGLALLGLYWVLGVLFFPTRVLPLSWLVVVALLAMLFIWRIVLGRSGRARRLPPSRRVRPFRA